MPISSRCNSGDRTDVRTDVVEDEYYENTWWTAPTPHELVEAYSYSDPSNPGVYCTPSKILESSKKYKNNCSTVSRNQWNGRQNRPSANFNRRRNYQSRRR